MKAHFPWLWGVLSVIAHFYGGKGANPVKILEVTASTLVYWDFDRVIFEEQLRRQLSFTLATGRELAVLVSSENPLLKIAGNSLGRYDASHAIKIRPGLMALLTEILHPIFTRFVKRRRRIWHPPLVIYWPLPDFHPPNRGELEGGNVRLNFSSCGAAAAMMNLEKWKQLIKQCLEENVGILTPTQGDVDDAIYFQFEKRSLDPNEETVKSFWEVYSINSFEETKLMIKEVVRWDDLNRKEGSRVERRSNWRNIRMTVVAPSFDTSSKYQLKWEDVNGTETLVGGSSVNILRDLEDSMNFTSKIIPSDWIAHLPNGSLNGTTVDLLRRGDVDLMIGQTVPIARRLEVLEYLQPTSTNTIRAFVHQPLASEFLDLFIDSFPLPLQLALLTCCIVGLLSVVIACRILVHFGPSPNTGLPPTDTPMWLLSIISQTGWHASPKSFSLRLMFLTMSFTGLVVHIAYSAQIVSVLSTEPVPIRNSSQIFASHSSLPIYIDGNSATLQQFLLGIQTPRLAYRSRHVSLPDGVARIFQHPSCLLTFTHRFHEERKRKRIPDNVACNLYGFPLTVAPLPITMAVPRGSPLREFFNHRIVGFKERGLLQHYTDIMNVISGITCVAVEQNRYRAQLGLEDIYSGIIFLLVGYTFCLGVVCLERVYYARAAYKKAIEYPLFPWID